jgi:hypothetical protein
MKVVSLAPVPVASLRWRLGDGAWKLTIVVKLTMKMGPGAVQLAKRHDPIHEREKLFDDDAERGLYAAADLCPALPLVDVTLVGDAYAPPGGAVQSLRTRLQVQSIDKRLRIEALDSGAFKHAALDYRFADGIEAQRGAPAPGRSHRVVREGDALVAGYAPIPSGWRERQGKLRGHSAPRPLDPTRPYLLGGSFDVGFFNVAPPDQQLPELAANAELTLENLHPDHAALRTRLPNVAPQLFLERTPGRRSEVPATIRALWIDTRRSVLTVTWQATSELESLDERGKIFVAVAGPGRRLTSVQLANLIGSLGGGTENSPAKIVDEETSREIDPLNATVRTKRRRNRAEETQTSVLGRRNFDDLDENTGPPETVDDNMPKWLEKRAPLAAAPSRLRTEPVPGAPRPSEPPSSRNPSWPPAAPLEATASVAAEAAQLGTSYSGVVHKPEEAPPAGPSLAMAPPPPPSLDNALPPPPPSLGAAPAVNAFASRSPTLSHHGPAPSPWGGPAAVPARELRDTSSLPPVAAPQPALRVEPSEVVELIWHDPGASLAVRRRWPELCDQLEFAPRDPHHDLATTDAARARAYHLQFGALTEAPALDRDGFAAALRAGVSAAGRFTPPLVLLRGRLEFPFDDIEVLRAMSGTLSPVAGDDKKLREALGQVGELLESPLLAVQTETVNNFIRHLRQLYERSRRAVSIDYIDDTVERVLLSERRYQRRTLLGARWIRAMFTPSDHDRAIPSYLPEDLHDALPLMKTFEARLIAEARLKVDQYENHAHALRVMTLGRIVSID